MQTHDGLLKRRLLPTVLGLTLLGGVMAAPGMAQTANNDNQSGNGQSSNSQPGIAGNGQTRAQTDQDRSMRRNRNRRRGDSTTRDRDMYSDKSRSYMERQGYDGDRAGYDSHVWRGSDYELSHQNDVVLWPDTSSASSGSGYIYVLRNDTLYQMRVNDLGLVAQRILPNDMNAGGTRSAQNKSEAGSDNGGTARADVGSGSDTGDMALYHRSVSDSQHNYAIAHSGDQLVRNGSMTVSGDNLFVMRGNTLYQLRVSDLSVVNQKQMSAADMNSMPGGAAGSSSGVGQSNGAAAPSTGAGSTANGTGTSPGAANPSSGVANGQPGNGTGTTASPGTAPPGANPGVNNGGTGKTNPVPNNGTGNTNPSLNNNGKGNSNPGQNNDGTGNTNQEAPGTNQTPGGTRETVPPAGDQNNNTNGANPANP